jgi:hypothetical protein
MRKSAKAAVRQDDDHFTLWMITAGILFGTYLALAI